MTLVTTLYWPRSRAGEGLELLARAAGYPVAPSVGQPAAQQSSLPDSLAAAAAAIGLEVEPIETSYADVDALLQSAGPAILSVENVGLVMLAGRRGRRARVVRPDHRVVWVPLAVLRNAIVESESAPLTAETERLVNDMDVPPSRRRKVVRAIVADRLRTRRLRAGWLVRLPPATAFAAQLVAAGARRRAILLAAAHAAQYGVWLASWWLLGRAALV